MEKNIIEEKNDNENDLVNEETLNEVKEDKMTTKSNVFGRILLPLLIIAGCFAFGYFGYKMAMGFGYKNIDDGDNEQNVGKGDNNNIDDVTDDGGEKKKYNIYKNKYIGDVSDDDANNDNIAKVYSCKSSMCYGVDFNDETGEYIWLIYDGGIIYKLLDNLEF